MPDHTQENKNIINGWFVIRNNEGQKAISYLNAEIEKLSNMNSVFQQNYSSKL